MLLASAALLRAGEWPGWRGPDRDGNAAAYAVPESWPEELELRWKVRVGVGHSTPAVAAGKIFVHSREEDDEVVRALEPERGEVVWEQRYPVAFKAPMGSWSHGPGPKASPVHDGERLFTVSVTGTLSAWEGESGKLLWREDFADRFKKTRPHFGAAASPLVDGSRVVGSFGGGKDGAVVALDVETGKEVWASPGEGASYASAIVNESGERRQIVTLSSEAVVGLDAGSGRPGWRFDFPQSMMRHNMVTPLALGDHLVVVSAKGRGITALRVSGDGSSTEPAWQVEELSMEMSSPVESGGRIYGLSHRDKGRIFCIDGKSGEILWAGPGRTAEQASLLAMKGTILVLTDSAELIVLRDGGEEYEERARYTVADSPTWAHLVPVDGGVLIKDEKHLAFWSWSPR